MKKRRTSLIKVLKNKRTLGRSSVVKHSISKVKKAVRKPKARRIKRAVEQRISLRRSVRKNKSIPKKTKKLNERFLRKNNSEMTVLIAKGSAAVAAVAGVVAAGAYLIDKQRRDRVSKEAFRALEKFQKVAGRFPDEMPETYQAVQHEILNPKPVLKSPRRKRLKSKSSK